MNFAIAAGSMPLGAAAPSTSDRDHHRLSDAAQQFEGMLLQEMLKPMREHGFAQQGCEGNGGEDDDGAGSSGGSDTLSSFGTEAMASAIAKGGGLGIAKRIVTQVEAERDLRSHTVAEAASKAQDKSALLLKSPHSAPIN